jgi:beta-aspartyl-peptidase (threonine type)
MTLCGGGPLLLVLMAAADQPQPAKAGKPETGEAVLVIHGGEGDLPGTPDKPDEKVLQEYRDKLTEALQKGYEALNEKGATSLDGVEAAIRVMEDSPLFNAGKGAVFTHDGRNEMDASIMEGKDKKAGAVAGVTVVKNPISGARAVMEHSRHVLLAGQGAENFVMLTREKLEKSDPKAATKLEIVDRHYFWTPQRWKELEEEWEKEKKAGGEQGRLPSARRHLGTVGAVALWDGHLAAGTSTGGLTDKLSGRIGDSPIIGAGTYADDRYAAVSCTGIGEFFIRYAVAYDITARMKYKGLTVEEAARVVINDELEKADAEGAAIVLGHDGRFAIAYNTQAVEMSRGYVTRDGKFSVAVYKESLSPPKPLPPAKK